MRKGLPHPGHLHGGEWAGSNGRYDRYGRYVRNCRHREKTSGQRRPIEVITPVNSTHRFVLQAIEKGTLQNLVFDNQAFANHRAMAAVFGTILKLPPLKQALASKQFKSVYLDHLLARQKK